MEKPRISDFQGTFCKGLVVACLLFTSTHGSHLECCSREVGWKNQSRYCNNGEEVGLNCLIFYYVNPIDEDVEYYVDNSSHLVEIHHESNITYKSAPGEFCQVHVNDELKYLICFPDTPFESNKLKWHFFIGLCSMFSAIFLGFTLAVYLMLPELRELQDKAMMSLCASFMVGFFFLGMTKFAYLQDDSTCVFTAFVMYYSFLSAFFWLNVISFNIWKSVWFSKFKLKGDTLFSIYCVIGWGIPLCFLIFALTTHYSENSLVRPGFGERSCWFNEYSKYWLYFYGPILVLLLMNLIYLGLTSWTLWHRYAYLNRGNIQVLRVKCVMYAKLSLMMGATWIFEVISCAFGGNNPFYWVIPDMVNALQGVFIFLLFVTWRNKVKKLLAQKKPCNIQFPPSWAGYLDIEEWNEDAADNFQRSRLMF